MTTINITIIKTLLDPFLNPPLFCFEGSPNTIRVPYPPHVVKNGDHISELVRSIIKEEFIDGEQCMEQCS